ncbi:MAG: HPF/RaiA family ribosome-associated protein [Bradyrhizobiaceae bacterium]|nr:HPF/RaiA family ribosome-associated protein [Bradyrhizobiaceae bacterium]
MDVHIETRHCKLTDLEHEAAVKAAEHLLKFHDSIIRVDVTASEEAGEKVAEFTVRVQGKVIVAAERGSDHTKVIHDAREKMVRQLRKINDLRHDTRSAEVA